MRRHLFKCLEAHSLSPFPHKKKAGGMKNRDDFEVHCVCRMPEIKNIPMIQCNECLKWFHTSCQEVPQVILDDSDTDWFCHVCAISK